MLKASLRSQDPIILYDFLQTQVGPLKMLIKDGHALIKFRQESHHKLAIEKFSSFSLCGNRIQLHPQVEQKEALNKKDDEDYLKRNGNGAVKEGLSKDILAIMEGLEVGDSLDTIERVVKKHKKSMVEHIATFDSFMKEAQEKVKRYTETSNQSHEKVNKIQKMLDKRLKIIFKALKKDFINLSSQIKNIDQRQINLEPNLQCQQLQQRSLQFTSFKQHIQYINEPICIRRLCPLNHSQFLSSVQIAGKSTQKSQGRLKIYSINQYNEKSVIPCKEGTFGLLVLDKYIITGTLQGYFSFYHQERTDFQQLSPRFFGDYQNLHTITDILPCKRRQNGYNILALANKKIIKSFYAKERDIHPGIKSLIFQQKHSIEKEGEIFNTIEMMQQSQQLLIGCQSTLKGYNLHKLVFDREMITQSQILRMKKANDNQVYLAQRKAISLADLRTSEIKRFSFKADITAICTLNQYSVMYGTERGEMGLFDIRKGEVVHSNTLCHKQSKIYDIIKLNDVIVSGDSEGQIVSWKGL